MIRPPLDVLKLVVLWVVHPEVGQVGAVRVGGGPQHEGRVGRHGDHAALPVLRVAAWTVLACEKIYNLESEVTCVSHMVPPIVGIQVPVADLVIVPGHHSEDILMLMMKLIPGLDDKPPLIILLLDDGC